MANLRVISTSAGNNKAVHDTDVGLLGGVGTAPSGGQSFKIYGESGNLAFTISTSGNISFESTVITNIVFDNLTHDIAPSTQTATNDGAGVILLSGAGGVASGGTDGGIGGTTIILSGTGGAAAAGAGEGGAGGDVNLAAASGGVGTATGIGGAGGNVSIYGGNAGTDNGAGGNDGGNLTLDAGIATGAGVSGTISIGGAIATAMTISNEAATVAAYGNWVFTNPIITSAVSVCTAQLDKTDTNLANVTGLSATLVDDGIYIVNIFLQTSLSGGFGKVDLDGGTATVTSMSITPYEIQPATAICHAAVTALATDTSFGASGANVLQLTGKIIVDNGGTLIPRFAQNSASGTSSVLVGSYMIIYRIS